MAIRVVREESKGHTSISIGADRMDVVKKLVSNLEEVNGVKNARRNEILEYVKHVVRENCPNISNRELLETVNATLQALVAFPEAGSTLTVVGLGTFKVVRKAGRKSSLFGKENIVPEKNYFTFKPGSEAKAAAERAEVAMPKGKLKKDK